MFLNQQILLYFFDQMALKKNNDGKQNKVYIPRHYSFLAHSE